MKLYSRAEQSCIDVTDKIENNKALVFAKKGQYGLAIERLTEAIGHNPNNGNAYYNRGITYLLTDDYPSAVADLEKAQFLGTDTDQNINYNIAIAYYLSGDIEKAQLYLDTDSTMEVDNRIPYLRGLILYNKREFASAVTAFREAYRSEENAHIRYAEGLAEYYSGNHELGLSILDGLKDNEKFESNYNALLANLAFEASDMSTAKAAYRHAIKKNKRDATAWAGLGNVAMNEDDLNQAAVNYNNALKYDSKNISALNGSARIQFLEGQHKLAMETYDKALRLAPSDYKAIYGKALAAMNIPDPFTCLDELAKIKKDDLAPDQVEKLVLLEASALGICNKKEKAVKLLSKYRRFALDKYKLKTMLAYYYLRMFQYGKAVSSISISKYKNHLPYLIAGHASLHRGQHSSAYRYYRKAYKIDPKNPNVLMGAALSMMEINMEKEAKRVIDSLEVLYPDNYYVFNSKGIIYKDLGLDYEKNKQNQKAKIHYDIAAKAFEKAIQIRPNLKTSFDNNLGLTHFYRKDHTTANKLFNGSKRLASINNRALLDISKGNYERGITTLDSLNNDFIRKNKVANSRVKSNLALARKRAPMNNNYKFITYYFLHQSKPEISDVNPFTTNSSVIELPIDLKPDTNYILEYADIECEEIKRERKKKKRPKIKLKFLKKKKSNKCPTFKT